MELLELPDDNKLLEIERANFKPIDKTFEFVVQECHKRYLIWAEISQKMNIQLKCKNYNFDHLKNIPHRDNLVNEFINLKSDSRPESFTKAHVIAMQNREYYRHYLLQMRRIMEIKKVIVSERKAKDY